MSIEKLLGNATVLTISKDDSFLRQFINDYKGIVGKIYVSSGGQDAKDQFMKNRPEILVTDLNELSIIKEIRDADEYVGIVGLCTGMTKELSIMCIDSSIDKLVYLPADKDTIYDALKCSLKKMIHRSNDEKSLDAMLGQDREWKNKVSDDVKSAISTFLKQKTKKGPSIIQTTFAEGNLLVRTKGALTQFEKSMIVNPQNVRLVTYNRKMFYNEYTREIEDLLKQIINMDVKVSNIEVFPTEDEEELIFNLSI